MIAQNDTSNLHRINAVSFTTTEACDGEFVIADNSGKTQKGFDYNTLSKCFSCFHMLIHLYLIYILARLSFVCQCNKCAMILYCLKFFQDFRNDLEPSRLTVTRGCCTGWPH